MWTTGCQLRSPLLAICALLIAGCGDPGSVPGEGAPAVSPRAGSVDPERVVALVDGEPITVDDVEELLRRADAGLGRDAALEALVEQQLLAAEAERRGFDADGQVTGERKRVLARLLLERMATEVTLDSLDRERLRKIYDAQRERFVHGPERRVVHAVALGGGPEAGPDRGRELAEQVHRAVRDADDEEAFREALKPLLEQHGRRLKVESLPPFALESKRFARPFVEAAFAAGKTGDVSSPFRTSFGWHVLLVLEELPAAEVTFDEAREVIGADVLPAERKRHTEEVLRELYEQGDVFIHESNLPGAGKTDG
jgi:parvulin-like peptidyl-prolyl isomerase